ncbi:DNA-binding NarL/FixJ family response regulator [Actinomadura coerulea]|uniref:DNA-binding NarL/FixJ family response regulator n=1 Tax=Actinomadura coerulea TaxID=46159 RepID=A0A7X0FXH7_9ACTN|nr:response regulator transcription factor [Actinomadura coerulea]MBB6395562.1 DNA-binding NarL/FixJ family response regulator [Actinomadura coerulea]GGQ25411.1 DNA-binding response regulator [Actinomadura coerulea]
MTIKVLVVDDQDLVRTGTVLVVDSQPDLQVVGQAANGAEAVRLAPAADIVLMDIRMPVMDGVEATRRICRGAGPRVLALTTFDLDEYAFAALRAGASGFLLKDAPAEEMLTAIRTVHQGDAVIAPSTTRRLLDHVAPGLPSPTGPDPLTDRERQVLLHIAQGLSNAEIAARLHLAEGTVKTHVGRILTKLDVRDRVQAVIWAYDHRLVHPA